MQKKSARLGARLTMTRMRNQNPHILLQWQFYLGIKPPKCLHNEGSGILIPISSHFRPEDNLKRRNPTCFWVTMGKVGSRGTGQFPHLYLIRDNQQSQSDREEKDTGKDYASQFSSPPLSAQQLEKQDYEKPED